MKRLLSYFTKTERLLWCCSAGTVLLSFCLFDRESYSSLAASLIGVTSLIFNAKGNPIGQCLTILFSLLYALISYTCAYYGEMATYLGMTAPMAILALISWLRNPYEGNRGQVKVNHIPRGEYLVLCGITALVTVLFYFILAYFHTANLIPSVISVTTSFIAVYLTFRRSPYYAIGYAANDLVLIVLWTLASLEDIRYSSVTICFVVFLANDIYGFVSWKQMERQQAAPTLPASMDL